MIKLINTNINIVKKFIGFSLELLVKFISKYFKIETLLSKAYYFQPKVVNLYRFLTLQFYRTKIQNGQGGKIGAKKRSIKLGKNIDTNFFLTLTVDQIKRFKTV